MLDKEDDAVSMKSDRSPHASPGNGEADRVGTFIFMPDFLPTNQLALHLADKGLAVDAASLAKLERLIDAQGYSRVRAFATPLMRDGLFQASTSVDDIADIAAFNADLVSFLLQAIAPIEIALRAVLVQQLGQRYGAGALHDARAFKNERYFAALQQVLQRECQQGIEHGLPLARNSWEQFGMLPIWTEMELTTLGTASKIYRNLQDGKISGAIAKRFRVKPDRLANWLRYLTLARNMCAHQQNMYACHFNMPPRLFKEHAGLDKHRLFPVFVVVFHLLDSIDVHAAHAFRAKFARMIDARPGMSLEPMGFPAHWRELLALPTDAVRERPRPRGRKGGRPKVDERAVAEALYLYDKKELGIAQIAERTGISTGTLYNYIRKRKCQEQRQAQSPEQTVEYAALSL